MSPTSPPPVAETCGPGQVPMPRRKSSCQSCAVEPSADRIDLMFKAFSDRTRLRLLHLLLGGESCVGDLVEILQAPQPRVSRHLAYLRKAGMVTVRQEGLWKYYSLCPPQGVFHKRLLECLGTCFGEVPELKADAARAKKLRRSGGCCPRD
jgi:ArsR family transcriptional regulator